ncbi:MAG TPA: beta-ketoacyl synthase N-terminal-like domain-containing protein [Gillisia sp.]|nr:beta-ketoacyl synthase N-terminal-like domain-containing protein [Gillisia sp.]
MNNPLHITSLATVSPLGSSHEEIWKNYKNDSHFITKSNFGEDEAYAAFLPKNILDEINAIADSENALKKVDPTVLYSIYASRKAIDLAGWKKGENIGINIGSSRGATQLFEKYFENFLRSGEGEILSSPSTTLGNISSWVAQDLQSKGAEISHSVTCSTGLHAILNGMAWLGSGMADKFLVGGVEAALTPFTISQMKAMKIYAREENQFPCRALDMNKPSNSMVLGEGAGVLCLERDPSDHIARIVGVGYATERLKHPVSISANAKCLQRSMRMAIGDIPYSEIDAIVMHAPGTIKGDQAELNAIKKLFGDKLPALTSNKWKIGHTFGASGVLSLELAVLMLMHQDFITVPFSDISKPPSKLNNILVNAVGFGGNAVSILVNKG